MDELCRIGFRRRRFEVTSQVLVSLGIVIWPHKARCQRTREFIRKHEVIGRLEPAQVRLGDLRGRANITGFDLEISVALSSKRFLGFFRGLSSSINNDNGG